MSVPVLGGTVSSEAAIHQGWSTSLPGGSLLGSMSVSTGNVVARRCTAFTSALVLLPMSVDSGARTCVLVPVLGGTVSPEAAIRQGWSTSCEGFAARLNECVHW